MAEQRVYRLGYQLKNQKGEVVDSSVGAEPLHFVSGCGRMIEGVERAVEGREPGECLEVTIPPALAYGEHQAEMVRKMPRSMFQGVEKLEEGMKFQTDSGDDAKVVKVVGFEDDQVLVDANHPLAGITLYFDLEILEARDATPEEIEAGEPLA
ncbi:peptidylprolyl isomerase [Salicola sp. Rm-C-2C1-2]|uniref:FKBP-type peptidyl-prolyl cis-trans isomerase n=1 Tax=Salicola sp. Rm-C-2C1-2 TaxID=3141321 RepID=UPI0032E39C22